MGRMILAIKRYITCTTPNTVYPSLISLVASVDVKRHVYLLTYV